MLFVRCVVIQCTFLSESWICLSASPPGAHVLASILTSLEYRGSASRDLDPILKGVAKHVSILMSLVCCIEIVFLEDPQPKRLRSRRKGGDLQGSDRPA